MVSKKYGNKAFSIGAKAKTAMTYKSSNTKVATVDSKGKVTIKAAGTASVSSKGTLTYAKTAGSSAFTVNKTNGKITVKKGLKKGTYKIKVKISAKATANYNAGTKTVLVTVRVK